MSSLLACCFFNNTYSDDTSWQNRPENRTPLLRSIDRPQQQYCIAMIDCLLFIYLFYLFYLYIIIRICRYVCIVIYIPIVSCIKNKLITTEPHYYYYLDLHLLHLVVVDDDDVAAAVDNDDDDVAAAAADDADDDNAHHRLCSPSPRCCSRSQAPLSPMSTPPPPLVTKQTHQHHSHYSLPLSKSDTTRRNTARWSGLHR